MPEIIFHPAVAIEVKASYDWYQSQAEGLGDDFLYELESAYQTIAELPDTWPKFKKDSSVPLLLSYTFEKLGVTA